MAVGRPGPAPPIETHALRARRDAESALRHMIQPGHGALRLVDALDCQSSEGGTFTEQETVLSAADARFDFVKNELEAPELFLSLPEGSLLRAVIDGEKTTMERQAGGARLTLEKGDIRVTDAEGVTRVIVRTADGDRILLEASVQYKEINLRIRASHPDGAQGTVRAEVEAEDGPTHEHGRAKPSGGRWKLLFPDSSGKEIRLKMQWTYDYSELCKAMK